MHKILITTLLFAVLQASMSSCAKGGSSLDKRKAKQEKTKKKKGATTCPWKDC